MLSREEILKKSDLKREKVNVPEWGGDVYVRELRADEHDKYQQKLYKLKGEDIQINYEEMTTALLAFCLVGENNEPLFLQDELKKLPAKPLKRLYRKAQEMNGETPDEVKDIEKN